MANTLQTGLTPSSNHLSWAFFSPPPRLLFLITEAIIFTDSPCHILPTDVWTLKFWWFICGLFSSSYKKNKAPDRIGLELNGVGQCLWETLLSMKGSVCGAVGIKPSHACLSSPFFSSLDIRTVHHKLYSRAQCVCLRSITSRLYIQHICLQLC